MKYYSALKKNVITKFAGKLLDLQCIVLSKVMQSEKSKDHTVCLIHGMWPIIYVFCKQMYMKMLVERKVRRTKY